MGKRSARMAPSHPTEVAAAARRAAQRRRLRLDRATVAAMAVVLVVWSACLWVLSGGAFGCAWSHMVQAAAAELAAVAAALAMPNWAVGVVFSLSTRLGPGDARAVRAALTGRGGAAKPAEMQWLVKLLAVTGAACAAGGLVTTAAIHAGSWPLRLLSERFLWPGWFWTAARLGVEVLAMLPMAMAAGALILTAGLLHRCGPSDPYRYVMRDLMGSVAAGLALAAAAWWSGLDLLGVALVCPVVLAAMASATAARRPAPARSVRVGATLAAGRSGREQRGINLLTWGALAAVVTLQCRALRDAAGVSWAGTWVWVAATAAIFAVVTRRLDRRVRPGSAAEAGAAAAGAVLVAICQVTLLALAAAKLGPGWLWIALAGVGQFPFAALAATVVQRRRRVFARCGWAGRFWPADACGGIAIGACAAVGLLAIRGGRAAIIAGALACVAAGAVAARRDLLRKKSSRRRPGRAAATATGALAVLAAGLVWVGAVCAVGDGLGPPVAIGPDWTARQRPGGVAEVLPAGRLPAPSRALAERVARLIVRRPGLWWIVAGENTHPSLRPGVDVVALAGAGGGRRPRQSIRLRWGRIDAALGRLGPWRNARIPGGDFAQAVNVGTERFDGIYLGGLRAGHPDAWCLYNRQVLARCVGRLAKGGLLVVHVATGGRGVGEFLAVAETFHRQVGAGRAAVVVQPGKVEALLVACPKPGAEQAAWADVLGDAADVKSLSVRHLGVPGTAYRPITLRAPRRPAARLVSLSGLTYWISRAGG